MENVYIKCSSFEVQRLVQASDNLMNAVKKWISNDASAFLHSLSLFLYVHSLPASSTYDHSRTCSKENLLLYLKLYVNNVIGGTAFGNKVVSYYIDSIYTKELQKPAEEFEVSASVHFLASFIVL